MRTAGTLLIVPLLFAAPSALAANPPQAATASAKPAASSSAQAPVAPPRVELAADLDVTARKLLGDGLDAAGQGDNAKALEVLGAAWSAQKHWQVAMSLAAVEKALGKNVEAANHLAFAHAHAPADRKEAVGKLLGDVAALVGKLVITSDPADAEILVDGVPTEMRSGDSVYVEADTRHRVACRRGGTTNETNVLAVAGRTHEVTMVLDRPVEPGPRKEIVIGGAVLAGAGAIAGAVMLGVGFANKADAESLRDRTVAAHGTRACATNALPECKEQRDLLGQGSTLVNGGAWMLIGAGAVAAGTLTYVLATRSTAPPPVQAGVMVGPNGGGAVAQWSF